MWIEAADVFLKDACNILGINKDSALSVITFLKLSLIISIFFSRLSLFSTVIINIFIPFMQVIVNCGCLALPSLLSLKQIMLSRQVQGIWSGRDELPVSQ